MLANVPPVTSRQYPAPTGRALEELCNNQKRLEKVSEFDRVRSLQKFLGIFFCELVINRSDFKAKNIF